jgi:hypothetical protein
MFLALTGCGSEADDTTGSTTAGETPASTTGENPGTSGPTTTATASTTDEDPPLTTTDPATSDPGATTGPMTTVDPSDTTGDPGADDSSGDADDTANTETTADAQELPPIESVEVLEAWLAGGSYKTWAAESGVHPSTGPHGGNVRTFVNAVALASLAAQNAEHPQDSATVKELYGGGDENSELIGYAVSLKTAPESQGGDTWYWYERINATTYASDLGVGLCTGCHDGGADFILTPYPLQ